MSSILLQCPNKTFDKTITLDGSKSISNRLLIINALAKEKGELINISTSDDTKILQKLLQKDIKHHTIYDVGHAGTSFRFLTAYLSVQEGEQVLTGSNRMKERPIGPLVEALNDLGANIEYLEKEGYPPLKISTPDKVWKNKITIDASISSQFISSLLLISPVLPNGLSIILAGKQVSTPYIKMTTSIMNSCEVTSNWDTTENGNTIIKVQSATYKLSSYIIEADWSAASYYYAIAALSDSCDIRLNGLFETSLQSDQAIVDIATPLGIVTHYHNNGLQIIKEKNIKSNLLEKDFLLCPDIAQTVMTIVGGIGIQGLYSGLETLKVKETDRFSAMKIELGKVGILMMQLPQKFSKKTNKTYYMSEGKALTETVPQFDTYNDHRMAMSLAPLAIRFDIKINNPEVVSKSYPNFWNDLVTLGFVVEDQV